MSFCGGNNLPSSPCTHAHTHRPHIFTSKTHGAKRSRALFSASSLGSSYPSGPTFFDVLVRSRWEPTASWLPRTMCVISSIKCEVWGSPWAMQLSTQTAVRLRRVKSQASIPSRGHCVSKGPKHFSNTAVSKEQPRHMVGHFALVLK